MDTYTIADDSLKNVFLLKRTPEEIIWMLV
jgi:hypothetical protein